MAAFGLKSNNLFRFKSNNLQYRVDVTFMADVPDIKNYICDNLTTKGMKMDSASVVDHNRNLVRLICSDKAGMGKNAIALCSFLTASRIFISK